tara:strand:+ start:703 stop:1521 length:819 start_codon:yes stop_codon:yes gene_type:complete
MVVTLSNFLSWTLVEIGAVISIIIILVGVLIRYRERVKWIPSNLLADARKHLGVSGVLRHLLGELGGGVVLQKNVITDSKVRWLTHALIFWGFCALIFSTTWVALVHSEGQPRPLTDPGKIAGNVGGAMIIIGLIGMMIRNLTLQKYQGGRKGDLSFFIVLFLATITGFMTQSARFEWIPTSELMAYGVYASHIVFIALLLVTFPFTHFFHAVSTPTMRFFERMHVDLLSKGVIKEVDYRQTTMSEQSTAVIEGQSDPVRPDWLKQKKETKN